MEEWDCNKEAVEKQFNWEIDFMNEVKNIPKFVIMYYYAIKNDI